MDVEDLIREWHEAKCDHYCRTWGVEQLGPSEEQHQRWSSAETELDCWLEQYCEQTEEETLRALRDLPVVRVEAVINRLKYFADGHPLAATAMLSCAEELKSIINGL